MTDVLLVPCNMEQVEKISRSGRQIFQWWRIASKMKSEYNFVYPMQENISSATVFLLTIVHLLRSLCCSKV